MKEKQAEILLAAVITARATSFIFAKWCLADLDTFNLLAVRFLLAFLVLAALQKGKGKLPLHDYFGLLLVPLAFLLLGVLFFRKLRGVRPAHGGHVRRLHAGKHRHYSRAAV